MEKIDNLKKGSKYIFVTKDNKEYKGVFIDKDALYLYIKNVRFGAKYATSFTLPIEKISRIA